MLKTNFWPNSQNFALLLLKVTCAIAILIEYDICNFWDGPSIPGDGIFYSFVNSLIERALTCSILAGSVLVSFAMSPNCEILKGQQAMTIEQSVKIGKNTFTKRNRTRTDFVSDDSLPDTKIVSHTFSRDSVWLNYDEQFSMVQQWIDKDPKIIILDDCQKSSERKKLKNFLRSWFSLWKPKLQLSEAFDISGKPMETTKTKSFDSVLTDFVGLKK